jgi:hypothetical protein
MTHDGWVTEPDNGALILCHVTRDVVIDFAKTFKANPSWKPAQKLRGRPECIKEPHATA